MQLLRGEQVYNQLERLWSAAVAAAVNAGPGNSAEDCLSLLI